MYEIKLSLEHTIARFHRVNHYKLFLMGFVLR